MSRRRSIGGRVARVGQVESALGDHDAEIGQKMALVLAEFHGKYVRPLEDRVAELERSRWERLRWWFIVKWEGVRAWIELTGSGLRRPR